MHCCANLMGHELLQPHTFLGFVRFRFVGCTRPVERFSVEKNTGGFVSMIVFPISASLHWGGRGGLRVCFDRGLWLGICERTHVLFFISL